MVSEGCDVSTGLPSAGMTQHQKWKPEETAEEVEAPSVEKWARTVAAQYGYTNSNHELELRGTCEQCSSPGPARASPGR